jgi:hypothetical protein
MNKNLEAKMNELARLVADRNMLSLSEADARERCYSMGFKAGAAEVMKQAQRLADTFGCGSSSCYYAKPTGMAVNGLCMCKQNLKYALAEWKEFTK